MTVPVKETAATDAEAEARRKAEAERLEAEKRADCLLYTSIIEFLLLAFDKVG